MDEPDLTSFPPPALPDPEQGRQQPPQQAPLPTPADQHPPLRAERRQGSFSRGFGLGAGIAVGVGVVSTLASIVMAVVLLVGGLVASTAAGETAAVTETIWGKGSGRLRAVSIEGAIMADGSDGALLSAGTYGYEIAAQIDELTKEDASALVLLVNTPGGSISGSVAIAEAIERYQERTGQKVLVHISEMSASGGVYSTAPADEIVADHGTLVGSIGVIMGPFTYYDGVTAIGSSLLQSGVTTSGGVTSEYLSAGTAKDFGNPFRPITAEERAHYQAGIDAEYELFVSHVAKHRGIPEAKIVDEFGALIFDPQAAKANGLIDDIMGRDAFFRHAAEVAGLDPADTRVEAAFTDAGLMGSLLGVRAGDPVGQAPAVEQGAGIVPALSPAICSGARPLVLAGDLSGLCR